MLQPEQEAVLSGILSVSSPLVDAERTLATLLGLHACHLARSTPLSSLEDEHERWLTAGFFSGGLEQNVVAMTDENR